MTDQRDPTTVGVDPGLRCLVLIAQFHGIAADAAQLSHQLAARGAFSETDLRQAARSLDLKTRSVQLDTARLAHTPLPALMLDRDGRHFVLGSVSADGRALIQEGSGGTPTVTSHAEVMERTQGRALLFASRASVTGDLMRFDFSWFIPALIKYRRFLLEVLGLSAVLQLVGLTWPLMFQVVMDKVLVNQALSTLNVVCVALLLGSVFEVLLTGVRNYILAHTTSRMDVELGAQLFRHLLALPMGYFAARRRYRHTGA